MALRKIPAQEAHDTWLRQRSKEAAERPREPAWRTPESPLAASMQRSRVIRQSDALITREEALRRTERDVKLILTFVRDELRAEVDDERMLRLIVSSRHQEYALPERRYR